MRPVLALGPEGQTDSGGRREGTQAEDLQSKACHPGLLVSKTTLLSWGGMWMDRHETCEHFTVLKGQARAAVGSVFYTRGLTQHCHPMCTENPSSGPKFQEAEEICRCVWHWGPEAGRARQTVPTSSHGHTEHKWVRSLWMCTEVTWGSLGGTSVTSQGKTWGRR